MLPVLEVERKRRNFRSLPPGFHDNPRPDNENNSSKIAQCENYTIFVQNASRCTGQKKTVTMAPLVTRIHKRTQPRSDLMPVMQIMMKRSKFKSIPPGFHDIRFDINNNSKETGKPSLFGQLNCMKANMAVKSSEGKAREKRAPMKWKLRSSLKDKLLPSTAKDQTETFKASTHKEEIAGEKAIINHLENTGSECTGSAVTDWSYVFDERLSPENYEQTVMYYDNEINKRTDLLKAIYVLGDMLVMNELEGDKEEWIEYTEKSAEEEEEWKEKCKASHAYFEKTKLALGQPEPLYQKTLRLLREAGNFFREACPCVSNEKGKLMIK